MILTGNKPKKARSGIACTLIRFSLPLIFSGILQQLYNWADAFIVGNVEGELALAAIGATGTVVNFYLMAITGFTIGLAILFAQKFGSGENAAIPKILAAFSILLGLSFVLLARGGNWAYLPSAAPNAYPAGYDKTGRKLLKDYFYRRSLPRRI